MKRVEVARDRRCVAVVSLCSSSSLPVEAVSLLRQPVTTLYEKGSVSGLLWEDAVVNSACMVGSIRGLVSHPKGVGGRRWQTISIMPCPCHF